LSYEAAVLREYLESIVWGKTGQSMTEKGLSNGVAEVIERSDKKFIFIKEKNDENFSY